MSRNSGESGPCVLRTGWPGEAGEGKRERPALNIERPVLNDAAEKAATKSRTRLTEHPLFFIQNYRTNNLIVVSRENGHPDSSKGRCSVDNMADKKPILSDRLQMGAGPGLFGRSLRSSCVGASASVEPGIRRLPDYEPDGFSERGRPVIV